MNAPTTAPTSPLAAARNRFRSRARWSAEDFDSEISATLTRVNATWPAGQPITDELFSRLQAIEQRLSEERQRNNMHGVRERLAEYERIAIPTTIRENQ